MQARPLELYKGSFLSEADQPLAEKTFAPQSNVAAEFDSALFLKLRGLTFSDKFIL